MSWLLVALLACLLAVTEYRRHRTYRTLRFAVRTLSDIGDKHARLLRMAESHPCEVLRELVAPGTQVKCDKCGAVYEACDIDVAWQENALGIGAKPTQRWLMLDVPEPYKT